MCWGLDIGDGWYDLIDKLCQKLTLIKKTTGIQVKATQVKEKFGTLRFYYSYNTENIKKSKKINTILDKDNPFNEKEIELWGDMISQMVSSAENISANTCEVTGDYGVLHSNGTWVKTISRKLAETEEYQDFKETKL